MSKIIIDDIACPDCNVPAGELCTKPVPPRVVRACSSRTEAFIREGSLAARKAVHEATSADIQERFLKRGLVPQHERHTGLGVVIARVF